MRIIKILLVMLAIPLSLQNVVADYKDGRDKSQVCAGCHGADGNSKISMYPRLAGQHKDYLVYALEGYRSGNRQNAIMSGFAKGLSDQDIQDLSEYYSMQKGLKTLPER